MPCLCYVFHGPFVWPSLPCSELLAGCNFSVEAFASSKAWRCVANVVRNKKSSICLQLNDLKMFGFSDIWSQEPEGPFTKWPLTLDEEHPKFEEIANTTKRNLSVSNSFNPTPYRFRSLTTAACPPMTANINGVTPWALESTSTTRRKSNFPHKGFASCVGVWNFKTQLLQHLDFAERRISVRSTALKYVKTMLIQTLKQSSNPNWTSWHFCISFAPLKCKRLSHRQRHRPAKGPPPWRDGHEPLQREAQCTWVRTKTVTAVNFNGFDPCKTHRFLEYRGVQSTSIMLSMGQRVFHPTFWIFFRSATQCFCMTHIAAQTSWTIPNLATPQSRTFLPDLHWKLMWKFGFEPKQCWINQSRLRKKQHAFIWFHLLIQIKWYAVHITTFWALSPPEVSQFTSMSPANIRRTAGTSSSVQSWTV